MTGSPLVRFSGKYGGSVFIRAEEVSAIADYTDEGVITGGAAIAVGGGRAVFHVVPSADQVAEMLAMAEAAQGHMPTTPEEAT